MLRSFCRNPRTTISRFPSIVPSFSIYHVDALPAAYSRIHTRQVRQECRNFSSRSAAEKNNDVNIGILKKLVTFMWPKTTDTFATQTKIRIGSAMALLIGSKLINIQG